MRTGYIITFVIFVLFTLVILGWFITESSKNEAGTQDIIGAITLQGEIVCLPHRNTSGPQTLECAYGLHDTDDDYYMLRDAQATSGPSTITTIPTGTIVEVSGTFIPEEDDRYATIGMISVDEMTVVEDNSPPKQSHSDGTIAFSTPEDFGLALSDEQILTDSVIPPCESGFIYCLYYLGNEYKNTNFESAGIGILKHDNLITENACLTTPPEDYPDITSATSASTTTHAMSLFSPLQNAGTGHYSNDAEYRLYTNDVCYEIKTRIGESQFENYPTDSVDEFTHSNRASLTNRLQNIVSTITLSETGEQLVIPR